MITKTFCDGERLKLIWSWHVWLNELFKCRTTSQQLKTYRPSHEKKLQQSGHGMSDWLNCSSIVPLHSSWRRTGLHIKKTTATSWLGCRAKHSDRVWSVKCLTRRPGWVKLGQVCPFFSFSHLPTVRGICSKPYCGGIGLFLLSSSNVFMCWRCMHNEMDIVDPRRFLYPLAQPKGSPALLAGDVSTA